ncbi:MAG: SPFH domain-containing protein [Bdellovibrionota bacterium]
MWFTITLFGAIALIVLLAVVTLFKCFVRCPSNRILCVYGKISGGRSVRCYQGGFQFVVPLLQEARFLDLTPMSIHVPLKGALSLQNIRVNIPATFTIAISTEPDAMNNAAVRLLDLDERQIQAMATEIITGQLRLTIASLTIEQINQDRERFLEAIRCHLEPELKKIGLVLINVNVTDITDESGYIDSIGKKAASTAINQAKVDVAEQEKRGEIGRAEAERERRIQVAAANASAVEGENTAQAKIAAYNASLAEQQADAQRRGKVAEANANAEIQKAHATAEQRRLEAQEVVQKEIDKRKIEIAAAAQAQKQRTEAAGEADAILALRSAEAQGIEKVLQAKADGYKALVSSCGANPKDAASMLLVEKLEEIVKLQVEAIRAIKIDKVTVWDSGNGEKGSSTANFMSSLIKSLPALHDVAKMAGMDLPEYLGEVADHRKLNGVDSGQ